MKSANVNAAMWLAWCFFYITFPQCTAITTKTWNTILPKTIIPGDVTFKVVEETLPTTADLSQCICQQGRFWHWRLKKCVPQGSWGYECGFFPHEHHHEVCKDGLKCSEVKKRTSLYQVRVDAAQIQKSFPATCVPCKFEDHCLQGPQRHQEACIKKHDMVGIDACVTVRARAVKLASARSTQMHTAYVSRLREATQKAIQEAESKPKVDTVPSISKDSNSNKKERPSAKTSDVSSNTSAAAAANSLPVTGAGSEVSIAAGRQGNSIGGQAQVVTVSRAASATKIAHANASAEEKATSCTSVLEAKKHLGISPDEQLSAVLVSNIIAKTRELAMQGAMEKASAAAQRRGLVNAAIAAQRLADVQALEEAKLKAEAAAAEASAWMEEAGTSREAQAVARSRALRATISNGQDAVERALEAQARAVEAWRRADTLKDEADKLEVAASKDHAAEDTKTLSRQAAERAAQAEAWAESVEDVSEQATEYVEKNAAAEQEKIAKLSSARAE